MRAHLWIAAIATMAAMPMPVVAQEEDQPIGPVEARMLEEPLYTTRSDKKIIDLEWCAAKAMTNTAGIPKGVYYDGPNRAVMFGHRVSEYKAFLVVEFEQDDTGTNIRVTGRNGDAAEGFVRVFETCK